MAVDLKVVFVLLASSAITNVLSLNRDGTAPLDFVQEFLRHQQGLSNTKFIFHCGSFGSYARAGNLLTDKYKLTWEADVHVKYVTFRAEVQTTGFVGLGISNAGNMNSADIFYSGVYPNGTVYYADLFSSKAGKPDADAIHNWDIVQATESGGKTTITFGRLFESYDEDEDVDIHDKETFLIWSFGAQDDLRYHDANRGNLKTNLYVGAKGGIPLSSTSQADITFTLLPSILTLSVIFIRTPFHL